MATFWPFHNVKETSVVTGVNSLVEKQPDINSEVPKIVNESDKSDSGNSSLLQADIAKNSSVTTYYGVSVPKIFAICAIDVANKSLVFHDKVDALKAVKRYKGARFKAFAKEEDAIAFSSESVEDNSTTVQEKILGPEKVTEFHCPPRPEIIKLRKAIECGDIALFSSMVWSNPRFLISGVDTPTIMMEGYRYNGLHVAAKHKQPELCKLIIEAIENPKFMEMLYPDNSMEIRMERTNYLLDLYLNMPDKKLSETPLHFASKFGCLKAVEVIISHPACNKRLTNKYGLEARQIICERCPASELKLKREIEAAFDEKYFVPVLRSKDNAIQPIVGKPYSPESSQVFIESSQSSLSPRSPERSIMAVAGPMSPEQASRLYKQWKTPPSKFFKDSFQFYRVRLSDTDKGLERIGRELAREMKTKWTEYWPSLGTWCDLSTDDGLQVLENHLLLKYKSLSSKKIYSRESSVPGEEASLQENDPSVEHSKSSDLLTSPSSDSSSGISQLCNGLLSFHVTEPIRTDVVTRLDAISTQQMIADAMGDKEVSAIKTVESKSGNSKCVLMPSKLSNVSKQNNVLEKSQYSKIGDPPNYTNSGDSDCLVKTTQSVSDCDAHVLKPDVLNSIHNKMTTPSEIEEEESTVKENHCHKEHKNCENSVNSMHFVERNIVKKLLEVIASINCHSGSTSDNGKKIHHLLSEDVLPEMQCLLKSSLMNNCDLSRAHSNIAKQIYQEMECQFLKHEIEIVNHDLMTYIGFESLVLSSDDEEEFKKSVASHRHSSQVPNMRHELKWQHLWCILKFLCEYISDDSHVSAVCVCDWGKKEPNNGFYSVCGSESPAVSMSSKECFQGTKAKLNFNSSNNSLDTGSSDTDSADEFATPPSSPVLRSYSDDEEDEPVTPDEGIEIYVEGEWPSKADVDILRVIQDIFIDPIRYPHIVRWKHLISLKDKKVIESWPSPSVKKYRQYRNTISKSLSSSPISPLAFSDKMLNDSSTPCSSPVHCQASDIKRNLKKVLAEDSGDEAF